MVPWVAITSLVVAAVSTVAAVYAVMRARSKDAKVDIAEVIRVAVSEAVVSLHEDVRALQTEVKRLDERGSRRLQELIDKVSVIETKIEVFWRSVAFDAAQILHKPHLGRERMDELLDMYKEAVVAGRQLPEDVRAELLAKLELIRDYKPGMVVPEEDASLVPPDTGERLSASFLYRILEVHSSVWRKK